MSSHTLFVLSTSLALAAGFLGACGGKQLGGPGDGGSFGEGGVFTEPDGATCIDIVAASFDQSCNQDSDCISITSGVLCSRDCLCGGGTINKSGEARYQSELDQLPPSAIICDCVLSVAPRCVGGTCSLCSNGSTNASCTGSGSGGGGGSSSGSGSGSGAADGGIFADATGPDGGACVNIDPKSFDQSCNKASDCVGITPGLICSGGCACGGATINKSGEAAYEKDLSALTLEACPCVAAGQPECVYGTCTMCGYGTSNPPGCPDGG